MLGLINNAFCDYVRKHSGEEAWRRIEDQLETRFFIGIEDYDDQTTLALAAAAAAEVGLPQDGVFEAVGEHFSRTTVARDFGILLNAGGKTFPEFLRELPEIQTRVELIYPSLKAPHRCSRGSCADSPRSSEPGPTFPGRPRATARRRTTRFGFTGARKREGRTGRATGRGPGSRPGASPPDPGFDRIELPGLRSCVRGGPSRARRLQHANPASLRDLPGILPPRRRLHAERGHGRFHRAAAATRVRP